MSLDSYEKFRDSLSKRNREILEKIYSEKFEEHKNRIEEGFDSNQMHNKLVNFCINCFQTDSFLYNKTGYEFVFVDPLYQTGPKNFDIAIFKIKNKGLLLVECKSRISDYDEIIDDVQETISDTIKNVYMLENYFGPLSFINYVLCVDAVDAQKVVEKIYERNVPICTWGCSFFQKRLRLFKSEKESHIQSIESGRMHGDESLRRILYEGHESARGTESTIPIFPSSHMLTILNHTNMTLIESSILRGIPLDSFDFVRLNEIMEREMLFTTFNAKKVEELTQKMIETALKKQIYEDKEKDIIDIMKKSLRFSIPGRKPSTIIKNIHKSYIELNAMNRAKSDALEEIKNVLGITTLDRFFKVKPEF